MEYWQYITGHFNYIVVIVLMMTGLYIVIATGNLVKKLVGLGVFQTAVFQLYITMSKVSGGVPPILNLSHKSAKAGHGAAEHESPVPESPVHESPVHENPVPETIEHETVEHGVAAVSQSADAAHGAVTHGSASIARHLSEVPIDGVIYSNPLPHVLILTAIVVGVATLAVGLALVVRIREAFGTIEEAGLQEENFQIARQNTEAAKS